MNQVNRAINYMLNHGPLTRQIAFISLDIANITAVISDVRDALGENAVVTVDKEDPKGRRYASYRLHTNTREMLIKQGRFNGGRPNV